MKKKLTDEQKENNIQVVINETFKRMGEDYDHK